DLFRVQRNLSPLFVPCQSSPDQALIPLDSNRSLSLHIFLHGRGPSPLLFYTVLDLKPCRVRVRTGSVGYRQHLVAGFRMVEYGGERDKGGSCIGVARVQDPQPRLYLLLDIFLRQPHSLGDRPVFHIWYLVLGQCVAGLHWEVAGRLMEGYGIKLLEGKVRIPAE